MLFLGCETEVVLLSIGGAKVSIARASIFVSMGNWRLTVQLPDVGIFKFSNSWILQREGYQRWRSRSFTPYMTSSTGLTPPKCDFEGCGVSVTESRLFFKADFQTFFIAFRNYLRLPLPSFWYPHLMNVMKHNLNLNLLCRYSRDILDVNFNNLSTTHVNSIVWQ